MGRERSFRWRWSIICAVLVPAIFAEHSLEFFIRYDARIAVEASRSLGSSREAPWHPFLVLSRNTFPLCNHYGTSGRNNLSGAVWNLDFPRMPTYSAVAVIKYFVFSPDLDQGNTSPFLTYWRLGHSSATFPTDSCSVDVGLKEMPSELTSDD